jgi:hypothetical protein
MAVSCISNSISRSSNTMPVLLQRPPRESTADAISYLESDGLQSFVWVERTLTRLPGRVAQRHFTPVFFFGSLK